MSDTTRYPNGDYDHVDRRDDVKMMTPAEEMKYVESGFDAAVDLIFVLAKHIANVNNLPAIQWGVQGMDLLVKVKNLDPERFKREIPNQMLDGVVTFVAGPGANDKAKFNP
jgi:hypothetical protein